MIVTFQKQTFGLKKAKEEHEGSHKIAIKRLKMEEGISYAMVKAHSEIAISQTYA